MKGDGTRAAGAGLAALLVGALVLGGCSVPAGSGDTSPGPGPGEAPSASPDPSGASSPSPSPGPSAGTSAAVSALPGDAAVVREAAAWLLDQPGARFALAYDRFRPDETLRIATATGVVDPAGDRGSMRYDLFPGVAADDPFRMSLEIAWTPTDWWGSYALEEPREWTHMTRQEAPDRASLSGRVQEEVLALVRFVAEADAATLEALPPGELGDRPAERWLVPVPIALTEAAFVPPDSYLGFAGIFDLDALPLEAWLVDGRIVRLGYVLEREESPKGGPDRHETWYDWTVDGAPVELVIPPVGEIRDVDDPDPG